MATTVGETSADFLIFTLKLGLLNTSVLMSIILLLSLFLQMVANRYIPWLYWLTVVLVSIVGTLITDSLVDIYRVGLEATTLLFSVALIITFLLWFYFEKTLSIHSINTTKRECFYWLAILFTFALGTAAGDLVSESWKLGYLLSGVLFFVMIGAVLVSYYLFAFNAVAIFWLAYILTRPLGASLGDYVSQSLSHGGLGFGTTYTSVSFLIMIISAIIFWTIREKHLL